MKQLYAILFVLLLIVPFAGTYWWLQHQKHSIKKQVKRQIIAGIDKNELVLLKFTDAEAKQKLRWKHSKEFEFNQQMYDVVEKNVKNDTVYYWCWLDSKETILEKRLNQWVSIVLMNNNQNNKKQQTLQHFTKNLFIEYLMFGVPLYPQIVDEPYASYYRFYKSIKTIPPTHPPC